jgi:O-antigen/teichoic acid export membrane protein
LTAFVSLAAAAVLTRVLSVRDYATYRQTLLAYSFAAPLLTLGLPTALYYFLPGEEKRRRGVLFDNLAALTLMGFVFGAFLLLGGNRLLAWRFKNPALIAPLRWMAVYAIFTLPAGAIGACLTVQNRVTQLSIFNVISRAMTLGTIIIAALLWPDPLVAIKTNVICAGLVLVFALWMMVLAVPRDQATVSVHGMFAMAKYAIPLGLASMLGTLTLQLGQVIVSFMGSPEEFAVYANGAIEIPLIGIITGSIAAVILVDMRKAAAEGNPHEALRLFRTAASKSAAILLPAMSFLWFFASDCIMLLYSEKYAGSVTPFRLYLLIMPARIVFFGSALMALGWTRLVLVRSVGDLALNVVLSIILVRMVGMMGAAIATVLMIYLWSAPFNLWYVSKGFRCRFLEPIPWVAVGRSLVASLAAAFVAAAVTPAGSLRPALRLIGGGAVFLTLYLAACYLLRTELRYTLSACGGRLLAWVR